MAIWSYLAKGKLISSGGDMEVVDESGTAVAHVKLTSGRIGRAEWEWSGPTPAWRLVAPRMFRRTYRLTLADGTSTAVKVAGMVRPRFAATTSGGRDFEVGVTAGVDREVDVRLGGEVVASMQRRTTGTQQWLTSREHWHVDRVADPAGLAPDEVALLEAAPVLVDHRRRQREGQD